MALGALFASSANTKNADAHSNTTTATTTVPARVATRVPPAAARVALVTAQPVLARATGLVEIITPPPADPFLENPKLRRMRKEEISQDMLAAAAKIVHEHHAKPVGTQIQIDVNGKPLVARIERHFHPEGGQVKPWGFHPGVSLFALR